jgi:hypothetical protein
MKQNTVVRKFLDEVFSISRRFKRSTSIVKWRELTATGEDKETVYGLGDRTSVLGMFGTIE